MSEHESNSFNFKRADLERLAGYTFDLGAFIEKSKGLAAKKDMTLFEYAKDYHDQWDEEVKVITTLGAMAVTLLPDWHHRFGEELQVQGLMREAGHDVDNDETLQYDLGLVFGYWMDQLISDANSPDPRS